MNTQVSFGKKIIVTDDGKKYEKAGKWQSAKAVIAADLAAGAVIGGINFIAGIPLNKFLSKSPAQDNFSKGLEQAFAASGLKEKGVEIIDVTAKNTSSAVERLKGALPKRIQSFIKKNKTINKIFNDVYLQQFKSAANGRNAFFLSKGNFIAINKEKFSIAGFHELGHALNKNTFGFGKFLQKAKTPFMFLTSLAVFTSLFKRKKAEGEKPKNSFDKLTTFVKKHCAAIAFLGFLPTLAEEGLVSLKGIKLAKPVLDSAGLKQVKSFSAKTYLTYLGLAAGASLACHIAAKVRDKIAHPKEIK